MPPILFLDIDGVLVPCPAGDYTPPAFSPRCVDALKSIIAAVPGLRIVFSTTWRLPEHVNRLHHEWTAHGLPAGTTLDATPDLRNAPAIPRIHRRGREILAWLDAHPHITRWAVIDDERLAIEPVIPASRCIFTNPARGLEFRDAEAAITILQ